MILLASIYNRNTRFLVVDIETAKQDNSFIFDIGFGIYSRADGFLTRQAYIVKENESKIPFYADRLQRYADYVDNGDYKVKHFRYIMAVIHNMIDKYKPQFLTAYNLGFDFSTIDKVCNRMKIANPLLQLQPFDMWQGACETIGQQKLFKQFVDKHDLRKPVTKNRMSGAETMYRYMTANPHYTEEHTGLGDILIEVEILDRIIRQKKPLSMKWGNKAQAWRLVQG